MVAFKSSHLDSVVYTEMPTQLLKDSVRVFEQNSAIWLKQSATMYIFDFKNLEQIHNSIYLHFIKFRSDAQKQNAKVLSINFKPAILSQIRNDGMERNFGYVSELKGLDKAENNDTETEVRTYLIKYLIEAARSAMNVMFKTTVAADENFRESQNNFHLDKFARVAAVQSKSVTLNANFRLYFEHKTLGELTKIMINSKTVPQDQELLDSTATELLNLIYGGAKSKINSDRGYNLPAAIPQLVPVQDLIKYRATDAKNLSLIPFITPVGAYYLEVEFGI